jgi:hypothetical protein
MARPSSYNLEIAQIICARISEGESLRQVCRDEAMPSTSTVMKWARDIPQFSEHYARAREMLLEHWAEEITEIADDGSNDWSLREKRNKEGDVVSSEYVVDQENINRSRLRVDTRKWLMSKLAPRKYGDHRSVELSGTISLTDLIQRAIEAKSEPKPIDRSASH